MPLGESMLTTIRSNKSIMLDKSKHFRKTKSVFDENSKTEFDFPKASPELLMEIKERMRKENKKTRTRSIIIYSVLVIIVVATLYFLT